MKHAVLFLVMSGATIGCMDTQLLDEMVPWDTDTSDAAAVEAEGESGDGEYSGEDNTTPDTEPFVPAIDDNDYTPPQMQSICVGDTANENGLCLVSDDVASWIGFATDEPAQLTVLGNVENVMLSLPWVREHQLVADAAVRNDTDSASSVLQLELCDVNDNVSTVEVTIHPSSEGKGVRITEVLADCLDAEPDGEFVEVVNWSSAAVDMSGWMVDDNGDFNGDVIAEGTVLAPGEVAVLAMDGFVTQGGTLIPLAGSIGTSGLKNSESETVELYDADGALVDVYENWAQLPKEGVSFVRRHPKLPRGVPNLWTPHPEGAASPGVLEN